MRLIDADKLLAEVKTLPIMSNWGESFFPQLVQEQPTIDAVSVVRCKDCKYAAKAKWNKKGYRICPASHMEITDDDFCSYAERRDT